MRAFKRAFGIRRRGQPEPEVFPPNSRPHRRLRLPALVGPMSFPSRHTQRRNGMGRRTSVDESAFSEMGNSAMSFPLTDAGMETPNIPAPIFYDMYDVGNGPDEPEVIRDGDDSGKAFGDISTPSDLKDEGEGEMEVVDAVHLDKATQANRFSDPRSWRAGEREYPADTVSATRPSRKRLASSQVVGRKKSHSQDSNRPETRSQTDYTSAVRHREKEARNREHEIEEDTRLDYDDSDDTQPPSDTDFSRTTLHEDQFMSPIGSDSDTTKNSRIKYSSRVDSSRQKKQRRDGSKGVGRPVGESPYFHIPSRQVSSATANAESLSYNAYTDALQSEARGDGGGLRTIVDLLRDSEGNPIVIEKAALVIGLLSERDAATRDAFGQFAAVQTLIQCLSMRITAKFDRALIVKNVTFALACLLRDSPRNLRLFEMFDGPYKMGKAAASDRYENKPDIPKYALRALSELKYYPQSAESLSNHVLTNSSTLSRTIMYILRAMTLHEYRTEIQECGLDALRTVISRHGRGSIDAGLIRQSEQATGTAFKMHKESAEIRWQSLTLLCDLDELREDKFSLDLDVECFFGALRSVVADASKNNEDSTSETVNKALVALLKRGIEVASNVGWRRQQFTERAVEAGAIETVLEALDFFGQDRVVVDKIYSILRVLLQSDEGKFRMNSVRSACAILAGIETGNEQAAVVLSSVSS